MVALLFSSPGNFPHQTFDALHNSNLSFRKTHRRQAISSYRTGWCGKKNRFLRFGASSKGIRLLATSYLKQVGRLNVAAIRIVADWRFVSDHSMLNIFLVLLWVNVLMSLLNPVELASVSSFQILLGVNWDFFLNRWPSSCSPFLAKLVLPTLLLFS